MSRQEGRAGAKPNAGAAAVASLELGIAHIQAGRAADAEACFRNILEKFPADPDALHLLGFVAIATGRDAAGIELIGQAIRHNRSNPDYYAHLGAGHANLGQLQEAIESYTNALHLRNDAPAVLYSRANALARLNRLDEALTDYEHACSLKPDYVDAVNAAGMILHKLGRHAEAEGKFLLALRLSPRHPLTLTLRGALMRDLKRFDQAVADLTAAIALNGAVAEAYHERGLVFMAFNQFAEAVVDFERAVSLKPDFTEAYSDLGCALAKTGQFERAGENLHKAIAIDPRHVAGLNNLGSVLVELNQPHEALEYFDRAIAIDPGYAEAHLSKATSKLRLGDLQGGWIEYEWRWKCPSQNLVHRPFEKPLWLGAEPIAGKVVLLHNDQGLGDALQFCRYVPLLRDRGAEVILEIDNPLRALLSRLPGISLVIAKGDPLPSFDFHCALTSLPLAFSTTLDTIPAEVPYLPRPGEETGPRLGAGRRPRIGLVWCGNPNHLNDHNRSLRFAELLPLLDGVDAQFVSLQKNVRPEDELLLRQRGDVLDLGPQLRDFSATAAIIEQLDLVISVDTSVAHLAGGLGQPVWVLLPHIPDWRWLLDREDSPWYPTAQLFRQTATREWAPVVQRVRGALLDRIDRGCEHRGSMSS
jgi:tetratricopeptide (TPR) repeat protein